MSRKGEARIVSIHKKKVDARVCSPCGYDSQMYNPFFGATIWMTEPTGPTGPGFLRSDSKLISQPMTEKIRSTIINYGITLGSIPNIIIYYSKLIINVILSR